MLFRIIYLTLLQLDYLEYVVFYIEQETLLYKNTCQYVLHTLLSSSIILCICVGVYVALLFLEIAKNTK